MVSIIVLLFPALLFSIFVVIASGLSTYFDSKILNVGEYLVVSCSDENETISWKGPKGPLNDKTEPYVEILPSHVAMIHFRNSTEKYNGNYTCSTETESKVIYIHFKAPLTFVDTKKVQTAIEFQNGTLRCEVKGGIRATISWYRNGTEARPPKYWLLGDGLLVVNVTAKDSGQYTCKATESLTGDIKEQNITLKVEHKPYARDGTVWTLPESVWRTLGSVVNLNCEVIAEPTPTFTWHHPQKANVKIINDTYKSVLQVNITDDNAFTNYTCSVKNKYGSLSKTYQLVRGEQPLPPDLVDLEGENSNLLDIGIDASNNPTGLMAPIGFVVQYRRMDPQKPHENDWKEKYFDISEKYLLRNLEPNSKYEVRVASKNIAGYSNFTNTSLFSTLESATDCSPVRGIGVLHNVFLTICVMTFFYW